MTHPQAAPPAMPMTVRDVLLLVLQANTYPILAMKMCLWHAPPSPCGNPSDPTLPHPAAPVQAVRPGAGALRGGGRTARGGAAGGGAGGPLAGGLPRGRRQKAV